MLVLYINKKSSDSDAIEDRIKAMVLGYEIKKKKNLKELMLTEGDEKIIGNKAIHEYLDKLQGELKQWWYCNC